MEAPFDGLLTKLHFSCLEIILFYSEYSVRVFLPYFSRKKKTYKMPICLQKPSCRQQNPLLAGGNNRKSLLPTNSSRPLFNQIAIFSGILTEHFNCKCFLLYTFELLEISPSGKDISLSIMTSRILASVHEQEPVKTDQEEL